MPSWRGNAPSREHGKHESENENDQADIAHGVTSG
jgi:hypothetical protein